MKTNYLFKARWLQGAASANESKKMQVNPRITLIRFACALLVLLTFGIGNAWAIESSEVASSKSTSVTDGDLFIIATAKDGYYLTSTVASNWGEVSTTLSDAAIFTAHGNTSGFYLTCPAGRLVPSTGSFQAYDQGTSNNLSLNTENGRIQNSSNTSYVLQSNSGSSYKARWYTASQVDLYLFKVTITPKTLTYNAGSGSSKSSDTEASGAAGIVLPSATLSSLCADDGWVFAGWKQTSAQTATTTIPTLYKAGSRYYPSSDETLYAVYRKGTYTEIDFESEISSYTDWTFTNIGLNAATPAITAHGGSQYGRNVNGSGSGVTTASIVTKSKIASPGGLLFYVSKESTNSTASYWSVETSSDGSSWAPRKGDSISAAGMNKGEWQVLNVDLSSFSNVYVRINYGSSGAIRAIDDIVLSSATFNSNPDCTYDWFVDIMHDTEIDPKQGTYSMPSAVDASKGDDYCDEKHYHFLGWIEEQYIDEDGTLKDVTKIIAAGDAGHTAANKTFYAVWAE